jgi:YbbR domain-containing protein
LNRGKLLEKITEKWPVKVLSVAAALIIWVFYRMNTLETRFITVPLQIEANELLIPVSSFASTVRVSLRGEANGINPILEEDIEAYIDLKRYTGEGSYRIPVQIKKKGSALGIEPMEITVVPSEILLMLEQRVSRNIPVFPVFEGTIAQGYEMTGQSIIPDSVIAEGPRSSLENQYEFLTSTIDLGGRYESFSVLVSIINSDPLITIHGNRMIEYHGTVRRMERESQRSVPIPNIEITDIEVSAIENGEDGQ